MNAAWLDRANCRSYGSIAEPEAPWPWDTNNLRGRDAQEVMAKRAAVAKTFCHSCPVTRECLELGISLDNANKAVEGIWGGLDPEERAAHQGLAIRFVSGIRRYDFEEAAAA